MLDFCSMRPLYKRLNNFRPSIICLSKRVDNNYCFIEMDRKVQLLLTLYQLKWNQRIDKMLLCLHSTILSQYE